jgi:hypothetical protein
MMIVMLLFGLVAGLLVMNVDITLVVVVPIVVDTVEMSISDVTNGSVNEFFVIDKVEVCVILVDEAVVGIGTGF